MDIREPEIQRREILLLPDEQFNPDNVCIVSGAGTGIGRATAIAAAANNLMVVGLDVDTEEGQKTQRLARAMGGQIIFIETDLTKDRDIEHAVGEAAKLGTIKFLANTAGTQHIDAIKYFPMEQYDRIQRVMLRAPYYLSRLIFPHMENSSDGTGVIGNMTAVHAHICTPNQSVYQMTQFGLRALTQSIAAEGGGKIRSFSVSTGFVKTASTCRRVPVLAKQNNISPEGVIQNVMLGNSRIKEMMPPIAVANLFLLGFSQFAAYLNGGDLLFDGGSLSTLVEDNGENIDRRQEA